MWKTVKLGEACLVRRGTTITKKHAVEGDVPVIGGGTKPTYFHNEPNRAANCITVSGSGASAGFVNRWDIPIFASDCSTVEPKDEMQLPQFVYYYLLSQQQFIYDNFRSGAAQPHVYAKDIETLNFPVLPLAEQQRIVAKLDAAFAEIDRGVDAAINKSVLSLELEKNFLETCFDEEKFESDCVYSLEQVVKFSSGNTPSKKNPDFWDGEFPWISAKDLKAEQIGNSLDKITKYAIETRAAKIAPKGSLLVLVRGMGLLNGIALGELQRDCAFNQDIKALTPDASLNPRFLLLTLKARFLNLDAYLTSAAHGTAKIDFERIKKTKVLVPALNQQLELVERYDGLVRQCKILLNTAQSTLPQLSMLKSAILTQELQPSEAA